MKAPQMLPILDDSVPSLTLPQDPSRIIVSLSGGKDSVAALLVALETFGADPVTAHYQVVPEDFEGTVDYCRSVCDFLGVPLFFSRGVYYSFLCLQCGHRHLSVYLDEAYCHQCGSREKRLLGEVRSIHEYIRHRGKWMGGNVRPCTKYYKIEVWNRWARENEAFLGPMPVLVMGERHLESKHRRDLPELRYRASCRSGWVLEWRPVIHYRRIDAFRKLREYGLEPHPCYRLQWRALLRLRHERWRLAGVQPRTEYPGQWDNLLPLAYLPDEILDPMIDTLMLDVDLEGGPRCGCRDCYWKTEEELRAVYTLEQGKPVIEDGIAIEEETGFTMKPGKPLKVIVQAQRQAPLTNAACLPCDDAGASSCENRRIPGGSSPHDEPPEDTDTHGEC